ncbi:MULTISPECIES: acyltransferase [Agrobacterium]|uniref:acyltransferase n=1 Tax=Agrobacterium TaxID=357 RepID=UPI001E3E60AA|nr:MULTISPECIES: acyltransferase [Agrobacterium]UHS58217.1 acyltransferase [Agrobacterium vaccinii]
MPLTKDGKGHRTTVRSLNAGFLTPEELEDLGIENAKERNILIHSTAVIVNFDNIRFGSHIRIDPYVVLSCSDLMIGNFIHIATASGIFGVAPIVLGDFSNLSSKVLIYSSSDDYSGASMTNPTVPELFKKVENATVEIGRHCIIGAQSTVLPGSILSEGAAVGSGALVKGRLPPWSISVGCPAKPIKERQRGCLTKEAELFNSMSTTQQKLFGRS